MPSDQTTRERNFIAIRAGGNGAGKRTPGQVDSPSYCARLRSPTCPDLAAIKRACIVGCQPFTVKSRRCSLGVRNHAFTSKAGWRSMNASKDPFDKPDSWGADRPAGGESSSAPSSATGIFSTAPARDSAHDEEDLLASLLKQPAAPAATPTVAAPAAPAYAAPVAPPTAAPAAPAPGSFTQMFSTLSSSAPAAPAPVAAPPPAASGQASGQAWAPAPASPQASASAPATPAAEPPPAAPASQGFGSPGSASPSSSSPGEFTRMLQALRTPDSGGSSDSHPFSRPSQELAKQFSPVSLDKSRAGEVPAGAPEPAKTPGSFTQMFSALNASGTAAPATPPVGQTPAASGPASPASAPAPGAAPGHGEFTRMFQASPGQTSAAQPASAPAATPPPSQEPGAFTRMFSQPATPQTTQESPVDFPRSQPAPGARFAIHNGAGQAA